MKKLVAIVLGVALAGVGTVALASRNSSGTHTLAAGNPVVSGTSISTTWANNTLGDISQSLTDSLDRNGKGGMLAPLRTPNGSNTAPTHSFTNDTDTGLYLVGDANPALAVAGTKRQEWSSAGTKVTGTLEVTGTSTLTGVATLAATPVLQAGASVTSGILTLSQAAMQQVAKAGSGALEIGTATGNNSTTDILQNGVVRWRVNTSGDLVAVDAQHAVKNVFNPVDPQDAATKGYVDGTSAAATGAHASLPAAPTVRKVLGRAYFFNSGSLTVTGDIADASDNFLYVTSNLLFTIPVGYRPQADVVLPVTVFKTTGAAASRMQSGYLQISTTGAVRFHLRGGSGPTASSTSGLVNTDIIYFASVPSWDAYQ